jgi:hypothetical protein
MSWILTTNKARLIAGGNHELQAHCSIRSTDYLIFYKFRFNFSENTSHLNLQKSRLFLKWEELVCLLLALWGFIAWVYFCTLKKEATCSSKHPVVTVRVYGVISQKIELFAITVLRTSYPLCNGNIPNVTASGRHSYHCAGQY